MFFLGPAQPGIGSLRVLHDPAERRYYLKAAVKEFELQKAVVFDSHNTILAYTD